MRQALPRMPTFFFLLCCNSEVKFLFSLVELLVPVVSVVLGTLEVPNLSEELIPASTFEGTCYFWSFDVQEEHKSLFFFFSFWFCVIFVWWLSKEGVSFQSLRLRFFTRNSIMRQEKIKLYLIIEASFVEVKKWEKGKMNSWIFGYKTLIGNYFFFFLFVCFCLINLLHSTLFYKCCFSFHYIWCLLKYKLQ